VGRLQVWPFVERARCALCGENVGWRGGRVHKACDDQIDWHGPFEISPIEPDAAGRLMPRFRRNRD